MKSADMVPISFVGPRRSPAEPPWPGFSGRPLTAAQPRHRKSETERTKKEKKT
jgi:hypothetical protein